jgi:Protein of unknown function (DUF1579)
MTKRLISCALLAVAPVLAAAQAPAPTPTPSPAPTATPAPLPTPAPEAQKLDFLAGDWIHAENYYPGPMGPGGKGGGRSKSTWILGNHDLLVTYVTKTPMGTIEGRGVLGWDPDKKAYRMDWFDNTGDAVHYNGNFNPEGVLALTADRVHAGQSLKEQFLIKKQDDGTVLFTAQVAGPDGAMKTTMESLATRDAKK